MFRWTYYFIYLIYITIIMSVQHMSMIKTVLWIMSEMIQIGSLATFLKSHNMKNILIYLNVNFVLINFFSKITWNILTSLRLNCFQYSINSCQFCCNKIRSSLIFMWNMIILFHTITQSSYSHIDCKYILTSLTLLHVSTR